MTKYVLLVLGCVVIENLIDLILPSGKMSAFIKNIIGVFIFAILLIPIIDLLNGF